jgi:hypothetical protein
MTGIKPRSNVMFRKVLAEFADEAAFLIPAFFVRHIVLLIALTSIILMALARP